MSENGTQETQPEKQLKQTKMGHTTLAALGTQLPIGVARAGTLHKGFTLKPFRLREETDLARLKNEAGGVTGGQFASMVLAVMTEEVGGMNIQGMKPNDRLAFFSKMFMPDVLYMYVYLRYEAMGHDIRLMLRCPQCRQKDAFIFRGDLRTMEVRTVEALGDLNAEYKLFKPFQFRGAPRSMLKTTTPPWSAMEARSVKNMAEVQATVLRNIIVGMDGLADSEWSPLPDNVLQDNLVKRDFELLQAHYVKNNPGPVMAVQATCPDCQLPLLQPLDWGYDHFFGASSL